MNQIYLSSCRLLYNEIAGDNFDEVQELKQQNDQLKSENVRLKSEKDQLKSDNVRLKSEKDQLKSENVRLKSEIEQLNKRSAQNTCS